MQVTHISEIAQLIVAKLRLAVLNYSLLFATELRSIIMFCATQLCYWPFLGTKYTPY